MTQNDKQWKRRYQYLLNYLIEKGVLTNTRYDNGTWVLRGIYGVDDSGLMGAGTSPEEAIDNAIIMSTMTAKDAEAFRQSIHEGRKVAKFTIGERTIAAIDIAESSTGQTRVHKEGDELIVGALHPGDPFHYTVRCPQDPAISDGFYVVENWLKKKVKE